jgi:hypothetical protein
MKLVSRRTRFAVIPAAITITFLGLGASQHGLWAPEDINRFG